MFKVTILLVLFLNCPLSLSSSDFSGKDSMNDIHFEEYKNFSEKWDLVTIRFRKDSSEMRLIYANELAIKTLKSGSINYPEGSVIGKIGIHTSVDSLFISSVVPVGVRRYQLMVKDKKKYASTGGWGYALFDDKGKTFPEDPKVTQDACYACHLLAENRGDVFAQVFFLSQDIKVLKGIEKEASKSKMSYSWRMVSKIPLQIRKYIPKDFKKVRWLNNSSLQKHVFQGTLDEIKPILEHEARRNKVPTLFSTKDEKRFSLVIPTKSSECMELGGFEIITTSLDLKPIITRYCTHD